MHEATRLSSTDTKPMKRTETTKRNNVGIPDCHHDGDVLPTGDCHHVDDSLPDGFIPGDVNFVHPRLDWIKPTEFVFVTNCVQYCISRITDRSGYPDDSFDSIILEQL